MVCVQAGSAGESIVDASAANSLRSVVESNDNNSSGPIIRTPQSNPGPAILQSPSSQPIPLDPRESFENLIAVAAAMLPSDARPKPQPVPQTKKSKPKQAAAIAAGVVPIVGPPPLPTQVAVNSHTAAPSAVSPNSTAPQIAATSVAGPQVAASSIAASVVSVGAAPMLPVTLPHGVLPPGNLAFEPATAADGFGTAWLVVGASISAAILCVSLLGYAAWSIVEAKQGDNIAQHDPADETSNVISNTNEAGSNAAATDNPDTDNSAANSTAKNDVARIDAAKNLENELAGPPKTSDAGEGPRIANKLPTDAAASAVVPREQVTSPPGNANAGDLSIPPDAPAGPIATRTDNPEPDAVVKSTVAAKPDIADPAAAINSELPAATVDVPLKRIPPRKIDLEAQFAMPLSGVRFSQTPLHEFLAAISQLSTIPISIDADALAGRGLTADLQVSIQLDNTTLRQVLDKALNPHGLVSQPVAHPAAAEQLVVTTLESATIRRSRYAVDDLVRPGDPAIGELARLVRMSIAPNSWKEAGGMAGITVVDNALVVEQTETAHDQIVVLCEKLRVARGRPLRTRFDARQAGSARFDPRRFELTHSTAKLKTSFAQSVTAGFGQPTPFARVVEHLQQQTGALVLVDAVGLSGAELSAQTESILKISDRPLFETLGPLTAPVGLTYRLIGDRTVEITTLAAAESRPDVEFYSMRGLLRQGESTEVFVERMQEQLAAVARVDEDKMRLFFDVPSQNLIISAAAPIQRAVEVELGRPRTAAR